MVLTSVPTPTMRQLPDNWRLVKLGDVCEEATGVRDPRREPDESFRYVDITSVDNKTKRIVEAKTLLGQDAPSRARKVIRTGDVIVSTTRPNLNAVAFVPSELDDQICSTGFSVLRTSSDLDSDYLFAFVQTKHFVESLSELVKGALYPAVTDNQVREQTIPLPPLVEQKRIAGILREQMAAVARARRSAEAQSQAAEALPAAYLRAVFNSPEAQRWPRKRLGEMCSLVNGDAYRDSDWTTAGTRIIRIQNLNDDSKPFNHWAGSLDDRVIVNSGDVLLAWSGTPGTSFGAHLWRRGLGVLNQHIFRVDLDATRIRPDWAVVAVNEQLDVMIGKAHGGVGLRHVTKGKVEALEICVPPLADQQRIAAQLSSEMESAERLRQTLADQLHTINKLPAALLRRAFNGEL